jgi:hypothetical protein
MYKLTAICPTDDARAVVAALQEEHGASNVMRTRSVGGTEVEMIDAHVRSGSHAPPARLRT